MDIFVSWIAITYIRLHYFFYLALLFTFEYGEETGRDKTAREGTVEIL